MITSLSFGRLPGNEDDRWAAADVRGFLRTWVPLAAISYWAVFSEYVKTMLRVNADNYPSAFKLCFLFTDVCCQVLFKFLTSGVDHLAVSFPSRNVHNLSNLFTLRGSPCLSFTASSVCSEGWGGNSGRSQRSIYHFESRQRVLCFVLFVCVFSLKNGYALVNFFLRGQKLCQDIDSKIW